jgi:transcriptional regulator with XRE-family HTH domain
VNTLSDRIKTCRNKLHLSQEYVANYMAMNRATITQIELGKRKVTAEELAKFSRLFGISADGLLLGDNIEMPSTIFARSFSELDERDQNEIMSLMQFKKMMKEQKRTNE